MFLSTIQLAANEGQAGNAGAALAVGRVIKPGTTAQREPE
jgi:hypothetical protein